MSGTHSSSTEVLAVWQAAQQQLHEQEQALVAAMLEYAQTRGEPPRKLIIDIERKRNDVQALFEIAMSVLDAQSLARTGHTNFGTLN